jgi:hypothetical protein
MTRRVSDRSILVVSLLIAIAWMLASIPEEFLHISVPVRILIGLVPVSLLVFQIILAYRYAMGQDEVQKRIILEGVTIAFSVALPVIFLLGFVMEAGVRLPLTFMDSGYFLEIALLIGYAIAYRRYV